MKWMIRIEMTRMNIIDTISINIKNSINVNIIIIIIIIITINIIAMTIDQLRLEMFLATFFLVERVALTAHQMVPPIFSKA